MQDMTNMGHSASGVDTAGAVLLLLWAAGMWAAVAGLAYANRGTPRPWVFRACLTVIIIGVIGQIGHLTEHVAQVGYWLQHPNSPPWMTPWGSALARGFGRVDTSKPTLGMEILHLTGNFIFLAGLAAVMVISRRTRAGRARKWGKMGVWMQGIHGLEHLSLTLSVAFGAKQAIGLSTWFGLLDPGPGLATYRIWWHFLANVIGSCIFAAALYHLWRERHEIRAAHDAAPTAGAAPATAPDLTPATR
jgi:uncharacterized protein DUF6008